VIPVLIELDAPTSGRGVEIIVGDGGGSVIEEEGAVKELVLVAGGNAAVSGGVVELVDMISELDPTGDRLPFNPKVHDLTSRIISLPCASFNGVKTMTQVTITVPVGESAKPTEVTVRGLSLLA